VGHHTPTGVEGVGGGELQQVRYVTGVDVGKAEEASREVRGIVIGTENAAELLVEHVLRFVAVRS